jgi:nicotinamidase/pyrazinamidase
MNMEKLNKQETASFDVDAQYCFTPVCPDELPVPEGDQIVDELNLQATKARLRVGSKDAHSPMAIWVADENNAQFSPVEGKDVDIRWNSHAVPGTKGFELIEGLPKPSDYDFFVWKGIELDMHPYGACYHDLGNALSTGVIEFLKQQGTRNVIVGGLATEYCVKTTAFQLKDAGFTVLVNLAACRGIDADNVIKAVEEMADAGIQIVNSAADIEME